MYHIFISQDGVQFYMTEATLCKCTKLKELKTSDTSYITNFPIVELPYDAIKYGLDICTGNKIFKSFPDNLDMPRVCELLGISAELLQQRLAEMIAYT